MRNRKPMWEIKQQTTPGVLDLYIYGDVEGDGYDWLTDEVVMPRNALMMVHNMWMGVCGNAAELRKAADDLDKINEAGREAYLQKAGDKLTPELIAQMEDDETWLTAEECLRYGLADRYADEDADMTNASQILQRAQLTLEQRIKFNRSLAAQLRDMTQAQAAQPEGDPPANPQEPQQNAVENPIMKLFERRSK